MNRGRYALAFLTRPFRRQTPSGESLPVPNTEQNDDSTSETDYNANNQSLPTPVNALQIETMTVEDRPGTLEIIRRDIIDLLPFGSSDEVDEVVPGDDPTFQQLLCLSGLICGPVMYLVGGVLFCAMPPEHRQSRRWALINLILTILSTAYFLTTTQWRSLRTSITGIHMQDAQNHIIPKIPEAIETVLKLHTLADPSSWNLPAGIAMQNISVSSIDFVGATGRNLSLYEDSEMSGKVFLRTLLAGYNGQDLHRSHFIDCSQNACLLMEAADSGAMAMLSCDDGNSVKLWVLEELENGDIPNVIIQDAEVEFGTQRKRCKPVFSINLPNLYLVGVQLGTPT